MLLNSFDDYMLYTLLAHLFHTSITTAYWTFNLAIAFTLLLIAALILLFKH